MRGEGRYGPSTGSFPKRPNTVQGRKKRDHGKPSGRKEKVGIATQKNHGKVVPTKGGGRSEGAKAVKKNGVGKGM